jgi:hypothetical protein
MHYGIHELLSRDLSEASVGANYYHRSFFIEDSPNLTLKLMSSVRRVALVSGALLLGSYGLYLGKQYFNGVKFNQQIVDLKGSVAVITGATAGIGKETALALASMGATLVLGCRDLKKGELTKSQIQKSINNPPPIFVYQVICRSL